MERDYRVDLDQQRLVPLQRHGMQRLAAAPPVTAAAGEAGSQSCSADHGAPAQVPSQASPYQWIANAQIHGPTPDDRAR